MDERTPLHDFTWTALRIVAGVTIFTGGTAKLFGWFGGFGDAGTAELLSRYGIAGVLETFCGALISLGRQHLVVGEPRKNGDAVLVRVSVLRRVGRRTLQH